MTARPLDAGHLITDGDLTWKRPATGISPADIDDVIGRRTRLAIAADTVIEWQHLE